MTTSPARTRGRTPAPAPVEPDGPDILCDNLVRIFSAEGVEVVALQGLDLEVGRGELVAIVGASGSGKSTLLTILSGLDLPSAGVARVAGRDLLSMSTRDRLHYRRHTVGFLFQQATANLLPYLTAVENVQLPMLFASLSSSEREERAAETLEVLGIPDCAERRLGELPAASSSASPWGWRWPTGRGCCSPTSRRGSSTAAAATRCSGRSATRTSSSAPPWSS